MLQVCNNYFGVLTLKSLAILHTKRCFFNLDPTSVLGYTALGAKKGAKITIDKSGRFSAESDAFFRAFEQRYKN